MTDKTIVFLGDSTLDNKTWTRDFPCVTEQLQNLFKDDASPTHVLNYAVDCFQTTDILNVISNRGHNSMKVVFDHPHFQRHQQVNVLDQLNQTENVTHIILSVGGNDLRNQLSSIRSPADIDRCISELQENYLRIIEEIRRIKPDAQLILMNQYTIDSTNDIYGIYTLFKQLAPGQEPVEFLHALMTKLYAPIVQRAQEYNLPIIDMASSLDHKDMSNFVSQIEPSSKASLVIAKLIKDVVDHHKKHHPSTFYVYQDKIISYHNQGLWKPSHYDHMPNMTTAPRNHPIPSQTSYNFLFNAASGIAGLTGLSAFAVAAIAIAGVITLSTAGIGLLIGAGALATSLSIYGFYKASKDESNAPLASEHQYEPIMV